MSESDRVRTVVVDRVATVLDRLGVSERRAVPSTAAETARATRRLLFGDELGLIVFLSVFVFTVGTSRLDVFINDTFTLANALAALARFDLALTTFPFGPPDGATPGVVFADGARYGRNYGQVAASLPVYLVLSALTLLFELRPLLIGLWGLVLHWTLVVGGRYTGRWGTRGAAAATLIVVLPNLALANPVPDQFALYAALQVTSAVATAAIGVAFYRFYRSQLGGESAALIAGVATLATPVGFFATVPKRHALTVLAVVLGVFFLHRTHAVGDDDARRHGYRFLCYSTVGGMAWIHAGEGLVLLAALACGDVAATRAFRPRDVGVAVAATAVSLLPFFATNYLIAGNPLLPPRALTEYVGQSVGGGEVVSEAVGTGTGSSGSSGSLPRTPGAVVAALVDTVAGLLEGLVSVLRRIASAAVVVGTLLSTEFGDTVSAIADTDRLVEVFLRRGYVREVAYKRPRAINLSLLESMPALGALTGVVVYGVERRGADVRRWAASPWVATDVAALVYTVALVALSLPRMPVEGSFTVRYLHPLYALAVYGLLRVPFVRGVVDDHHRSLAAALVGTVVVGLPLYAVGVATLTQVLGEAIQLYASVAVLVGALVALVAVVAVHRGTERAAALTALALGVGFGTTTTYLLGSGLVAFTPERHLLPVVDWLSRLLAGGV